MTMDRRGFLKGLALGSAVAGTTTVSTAYAGGGAGRYAGHPGSMGLLHDTTLCIGCRSCERACNEVNGIEASETEADFNETRLITDQLYTVVNRYRPAQGMSPAVFRKHQCMHCAEPCCASVCFVDAFRKTPEGPVLYDESLCVGCRYCVFACPYYALAYEYSEPLTPRVVRCTMCYPRIIQGQNPACADACPTGAILYGERAHIIEVARERMRKYPGRYLPQIFGEHEFAGTSWLTLAGASTSFKELGFPDEPQNITRTPLPDFTTGFLSLAPLVSVMFPGLLAGFYAFSKRKDALTDEKVKAVIQRERVNSAEEMEEKLKTALAQAERDKNYAVERAIRDSLRRAEEGKAKAAQMAKDKAEASAVDKIEVRSLGTDKDAKAPIKKPVEKVAKVEGGGGEKLPVGKRVTLPGTGKAPAEGAKPAAKKVEKAPGEEPKPAVKKEAKKSVEGEKPAAQKERTATADKEKPAAQKDGKTPGDKEESK